MNRFKLNRFVLLLVATFLPQACFAVQVEKRYYVGEAKLSDPSTANLNAISFVDANTGTAVGGGGTILHTTDGGATWTPQSSGTTFWLHGVSFLDTNTGWAVGDGGTILHTTDG